MKQYVFEARFYETYYFSNIVNNILRDQFSYLRKLNEFYGDDQYLEYAAPFPRRSVLHRFVEFVINDIIGEEMDEVDFDECRAELIRYAKVPNALHELQPTALPVNRAMNYYKIEHTSFVDWLRERGKAFDDADDDDVYEYHQDLRLEGPLDSLVERAADEVFYVIFQNRELLSVFNGMMARQVERSRDEDVLEDYRRHFESPGVLKRVRVPAWAKRAVFFRDRGFCSLCRSDVSGSTNVSNRANYDHVVPLACGGLNDVTNLQLLCEGCNLRKGHRSSSTSNVYEAWYPTSEDFDE